MHTPLNNSQPSGIFTASSYLMDVTRKLDITVTGLDARYKQQRILLHKAI